MKHRSPHNIIFLFFVLSLSLISFSAADKIVCIDGRTLECEIVDEYQNRIIIKTTSGLHLTLPRSRIEKIIRNTEGSTPDIAGLKKEAALYEKREDYFKAYNTYCRICSFFSVADKQLQEDMERVKQAFIKSEMQTYGIQDENIQGFVGWIEASTVLTEASYSDDLKRDIMDEICRIHCNKALYYLDIVEIALAKEVLRQVCKANPEYLTPYAMMAEIYLKEDMIDKAIECYLRMIHLCPNDIFIKLVAADLMYTDKKYQSKAIEMYQDAALLTCETFDMNEFDISTLVDLFYVASLRTEYHNLKKEEHVFLKTYISIMGEPSIVDLQRFIPLCRAIGDMEGAIEAQEHLDELIVVREKIDIHEARAARRRALHDQAFLHSRGISSESAARIKAQWVRSLSRRSARRGTASSGSGSSSGGNCR